MFRTLFGFELSHEVTNQITVISFASPRVGNQAFKDAFDEKINLEHYRVTNDHDIITGTPMVFFKHVEKTSLLADKCELFENYEYGWWKYSFLTAIVQVITTWIYTITASANIYGKQMNGKKIKTLLSKWNS